MNEIAKLLIQMTTVEVEDAIEHKYFGNHATRLGSVSLSIRVSVAFRDRKRKHVGGDLV